MGRKSKIAEIEKRLGRPIQELVSESYAEGGLKLVAKTLDISIGSAYNYVKDCGIAMKPGMTPVHDFNGTSELASLIDDFLMAKELAGCTKDTREYYGENLHRFLWWLEHEGIPGALKAIEPSTMRRFLYYVKVTPVRFGGKAAISRKPASITCVDSYWRVFQAFVAWLIKEKKIAKYANPMEQVERPELPKQIMPDVPDKALDTIRNSFNGNFKGIRDKAIFGVFNDTGARLTEMADMKLDDFDRDTNLIKVLGKGQKERLVPLGEVARESLDSYLAIRPGDSPYLWVTEQGGRFTREGIRYMVRAWKKLVPGVRIHPHIFRHAFANRILRFGGDPYALKQLGGWADLDMPLKYAQAGESARAFEVHKKASPMDNLYKKGNHNGG